MSVDLYSHKAFQKKEFEIIPHLENRPLNISNIIFFMIKSESNPCKICEWVMERPYYREWLKNDFCSEVRFDWTNEVGCQIKTFLRESFKITRFPIIDFIDAENKHFFYYPYIYVRDSFDLYCFGDKFFETMTDLINKLKDVERTVFCSMDENLSSTSSLRKN